MNSVLHPHLDLHKREAQCIEDEYWAILHNAPKITPFCASFLNVPAITQYTDVAVTSTTIHVFSTETVIEPVYTRETPFTTVTVSVVATQGPSPTRFAKRDIETDDVLQLLSQVALSKRASIGAIETSVEAAVSSFCNFCVTGLASIVTQTFSDVLMIQTISAYDIDTLYRTIVDSAPTKVVTVTTTASAEWPTTTTTTTTSSPSTYSWIPESTVATNTASNTVASPTTQSPSSNNSTTMVQTPTSPPPYPRDNTTTSAPGTHYSATATGTGYSWTTYGYHDHSISSGVVHPTGTHLNNSATGHWRTHWPQPTAPHSVNSNDTHSHTQDHSSSPPYPVHANTSADMFTGSAVSGTPPLTIGPLSTHGTTTASSTVSSTFWFDTPTACATVTEPPITITMAASTVTIEATIRVTETGTLTQIVRVAGAANGRGHRHEEWTGRDDETKGYWGVEKEA
ncbi:hypothetical protein ANO11243_003810 [Dothideomycetidae sp. 11243]|nr:hypothetical protein ANO11243_003810 [fungal sp. No.11243]